MTVIDLPNPKERLLEWKKQVLQRDGNACINCEKQNHVAPCFIVPPDAGGRIKLSNGVTLCRDCRFQAEGSRILPTKIDNKTAINFLMSRELHESVNAYASESNFGGISSLVRHMMLTFITNPEQFEDISLWQDPGTDPAAIKVNGWVSGVQYEVFKRLCNERNLSFTNVFKGLMMVAVATGAAMFNQENS